MLPQEIVTSFSENGLAILDDGMDENELQFLREQTEAEFQVDSPARVMEKDGSTVRGVHGSHFTNEGFSRLVRHPKILGPATQLLGGEVYVHQFKINAKKAMRGDVWPWHQDYIFWKLGDGMRRPAALNVAVLLDDATEINGPLLYLPGSQRSGMLDFARQEAAENDEDSEAWESNLSADLDYSIDAPLLAEVAGDRQISSVKGPAGSVIIFDPLLIHGSGTNMSPSDRRMILITYNSIDNPLEAVAAPRPTFLAARDFAPVKPLGDGEALVSRDPG